MPLTALIIFRDLVGKLGVLNVECGRRGRYRLSWLIARCGARCADLPKVV
jgi:hypothetical protein